MKYRDATWTRRHCYGRRISAGSVARALLAAGIDPGDITGTPDDVVTVTGSTGARFALGDDGTGEGGEQCWTGTRYGAEDDVEGTESWTNLEDAAAAVAAWYEKSGGNGRT